MCGIAGIINYGDKLQNQQTILDCMLDSLKSRGPDQSGKFLSEHAALVHTRLAVIDVERGRQPMTVYDHGREYTIVYNGELYNTDEVRNKLRGEGVEFQTHSDTEVVLKAFQQWGERCLDKFNGIYAFAVWDSLEERLFLARDRMGVKPLFFAPLENSLVFGSEIKALLKHPGLRPRIGSRGIAEILLLGPGRTPGCGVFEGVSELEPGQCAWFSREGLDIHTYWRLMDCENTESFDQTVEKVRWLVGDAIERQTVSDVPIGAFLSGGLDSSIISAIVSRHLVKKGKKLHTFSVDYEDNDRYFKVSRFQPNSDSVYVQKMVDYLGCEHTTVTLGAEEVADALYEAVLARDLPGMVDVDSSLLLFCRRVKQDATVVLSGECADEIFGGYPWFRDEKIRSINGFPWSQSTAYRTSFLNDDIVESLHAQEFVQQRYRESIAAVDILGDPSPIERRMKEMMSLNMRWFMQTLLDRKDRMSMYSGLEVRVPFCDHRIAEALYATPWDYKDYEGREKGLLRKAAENLLPDEVLWRKKSPYPKTFHPTYKTLVSNRLRDAIADPGCPLLSLVKKSELEKLLVSDKADPWYGQLMTTPQTIAYFLQIHYWLTQYHVEII